MPTPLEVADGALAAHTHHIGGMVNELGALREKLEASHEYEYQRGHANGFAKGYQHAIENVFAAVGVNIKELQSCP